MTRVREWKPGDVAVMPDGGRAIVAVADAWERRFVHEDGQRRHGDARNGIAPRPLVVIDPEDREQVERLTNALLSKVNDSILPFGLDLAQAALREFADPKPEEPTGLGAVVEDEAGGRFVRSDVVTTNPWRGPDGVPYEYADIYAVKVLSEGIPA